MCVCVYEITMSLCHQAKKISSVYSTYHYVQVLPFQNIIAVHDICTNLATRWSIM